MGKTTELKVHLIKHLNFDIIALCETFLTEDNIIDIDNYSWFGNNRLNIDKHATRGSGGVGMLVKNEICKNYHIRKLDASFEGILWLKFVDKKDKNRDCEDLLLCVCYCPPSKSSRGNITQSYDYLLTSVYMYYDSDTPCVITGDFNARIGDTQDFHEGGTVFKKTETRTSVIYQSFQDYPISPRTLIVLHKY